MPPPTRNNAGELKWRHDDHVKGATVQLMTRITEADVTFTLDARLDWQISHL